MRNTEKNIEITRKQRAYICLRLRYIERLLHV